MIEKYWIALFVTAILTGLGYIYLMRIRAIYEDFDLPVPLWLKILLIPQVVIFLVLDWFLNVLLTIPMLDFPDNVFELTTHRMKRYKAISEIIAERSTTKIDWFRYDVARWVCKQLNRGQKDHC